MIIAAAALPLAAPHGSIAETGSEPIRLKFALYIDDKTEFYNAVIKKLVEDINTEAKGSIVIDLYPNGTLGKSAAEQPALVLNGTADLAWVIPGVTPYRFPDNVVLELPGLFKSSYEASLVYTRMIAAGALQGYSDYFVVVACMTDRSVLHSRPPINSLADLKGKKIGLNNATEAAAFERLGAMPTVIPAGQVASSLRRGVIDGAAMHPLVAFQFGVADIAKNVYMLRGSRSLLAILMNRKTFEKLPPPAQAAIRKYSGDSAVAVWRAWFAPAAAISFERIRTDSERKSVEPSPADSATIDATFEAQRRAWIEANAHNRQLMDALEKELAAVRETR